MEILKEKFKVYKKLIPDILLLFVSLMSFILLYTSKKDELWNFFDLLSDWMSSLDWYWYVIVMVLTAIKPAYTIYTMIKEGKFKKEETTK